MVQLKARRAFPYAGRNIKEGEYFHASKPVAHVLKAIGLAEDRQQYHTRVMVAAPASKPNLEGLSIDELRALAKRLGVNVHHRSGVAKVRQAIRDAE